MQFPDCLYCGKTLKGRIDKKFCNDYCRNTHNNKLNSDDTRLMRNINNLLRRNRKILSEALHDNSEGIRTIQKHFLINNGFSFQYFTHYRTTQKGKTYYFCYDHGYLELEGDWILIVKSST